MGKSVKDITINHGSLSNPKPKLSEFGFIENDHMYWWARWYANILGYKSLSTLETTIRKAKENCNQLGVSVEDNFIRTKRQIGSKSKKDYKLTKFACFLIAMHADARKDIVKKAQVYFLNELEEINLLMRGQFLIERRLAREEIKLLSSKLSKEAARSRVKDFRYFINEGFLGMYNSTVGDLKKMRGIPVNSNFYDHLGITELSANIFRIALTRERLRHLSNPSEEKAAREHWKIGAQIRAMIKENVRIYPESLQSKDSLKELEYKLKKASKRLNKLERKAINNNSN